MSWDIGIEVNGIRFENADWNYTHNCNDMMRDAGYDWVYHLHGQLVSETLPKFEAMLANLEAHPEKYRAMNHENGWERIKWSVNIVGVKSIRVASSVARRTMKTDLLDCA